MQCDCVYLKVKWAQLCSSSEAGPTIWYFIEEFDRLNETIHASNLNLSFPPANSIQTGQNNSPEIIH